MLLIMILFISKLYLFIIIMNLQYYLFIIFIILMNLKHLIIKYNNYL